MGNIRKKNQLVVKRGSVAPAVYLMHVSDKQWEQFIEEACRHRDFPSGGYTSVKLLGNARDKGRDVEARFEAQLMTDRWDLYQAKHYKNRLTPSEFFVELTKFFIHIDKKSFPVPRKYYLCSPQNSGPDLHDLLANPNNLRDAFINAWRSGKQGLASEKAKLTQPIHDLVAKFDFSKFEECLVYDLLTWHEENQSAHYKLFGIEPERGDDPVVPGKAQAYEMIYVAELLRAYSEQQGKLISLDEALNSIQYQEHLMAARECFYAAEGLKRFSRDIYQEDEFGRLLEMVRKGINPKVKSPLLTSGLERHEAAISAVTGIALNDSVLHPRLRGGDLPGTCHHLVNEKKLKWLL